jgi:hypothetical protein
MPITWRLVHHIADDPRPCADLSATRKYHTPSRLINLLRMTVTLCPYMLQGLKKIGGGGGLQNAQSLIISQSNKSPYGLLGGQLRGAGEPTAYGYMLH